MVLIRGTKECQKQREAGYDDRAEVRVTGRGHKPRNAGASRNWKRQEPDSPRILSQEPVLYSVTLDVRPPGLGENELVMVKSPHLC